VSPPMTPIRENGVIRIQRRVRGVRNFDAADKGPQAWAPHWWFDPEAVIIVRIDEESWCVTPLLLREWAGGGSAR